MKADLFTDLQGRAALGALAGVFHDDLSHGLPPFFPPI